MMWWVLIFGFLLPDIAVTKGSASWEGIQGANYVPSYSRHDVIDIFTSQSWNATVVDRELSYARKLAITSLRIFVAYGGYKKDPRPDIFLDNYKTFQHMAKSHNLSLMATIGSHGTCQEASRWIHAVVSAEVSGVIIAYEAGNEPPHWTMGWVKNCSLPVLLNASRNPGVRVGVGYAHFMEVLDTAHMVTSLNWHSYSGVHNGGGLEQEISILKGVAAKFNPPKPLMLTEWHSRPTQPLAAAYPVIRDNQVAASYIWALVIVNSTSRWHLPVAKGDPPFQGLIWPDGTIFDDLEEGECMRSACKTLSYVHHCCNRHPAEDRLFAFSAGWRTVDFGNPVYTHPGGPREGSMRQTSSPLANVTIGPLPRGTRRVALYLPTSPLGSGYSVRLGGREIHRGTTLGPLQWEARAVLRIPAGEEGSLVLTVEAAGHASVMFNLTGCTFFSTAGAEPRGAEPARLLV
ncbi:unnamed protein product [Prorocentrum cordatum]|uniref:Uncharacterized protein n=1 Tax=Prorocentrum cordatum TaxID=2364126 RepID=A0ABN9VJP5_9DINO|nr:unnamed protein product [Polarella glacialis]